MEFFRTGGAGPEIPRHGTRNGRHIVVLARGETDPSVPGGAPVMTLREYGLLLQATDWLTFSVAVLSVPALVHAEIGPIGVVLQSGGILGTLAWKAGGLAVVYGALSYARPWGQFIGLMAFTTLGLIGTIGNLWALSQVLPAGHI